jgi:hypothetical protein
MLKRGRAKKLTIFMNEASHWQGKPLYEAVIELLLAKGLAGGTVVRAIAGFTRGAGIVTTKILRLSENLPLKVEVVDTEEAIARVVPDLYLMIDKGLITLEDVDIVKYTGSPAQQAPAAPEEVRKVTMKAKQLSVHISEKDLYNNEPLYEAILKRFNLEEFAGATVFKALEGFGAHHTIHRDRLFTLHREAPIVLIMIDTEENVRKAQAILDGMLKHGAVIVTDVEASFYGPSADAKPRAGGEAKTGPSA